MIRHSQSLKLTIITLLVGSGVIIVKLNPTVSAQTTERVLDRMKYPDEPLVVLDIAVAGQSLTGKDVIKNSRGGYEQHEIMFAAKNDWLKDFKITLKNVSGRTISMIDPELAIRHPNLPRRYSVIMTMDGTYPVRPDAELTLSVSGQSFESMSGYLHAYGADGIADAAFGLGTIKFADGTLWRNGKQLRNNPDDPQRWDTINNSTGRANSQGAALYRNAVFITAGSLHPTKVPYCLDDSGYFERYCNLESGCYVRDEILTGDG